MIYLDASALTEFAKCRELYRQHWFLGLTGPGVAIHREFGIAVHLGCESLWRGKDSTESLRIALKHMQSIDTQRLSPPDSEKWYQMQIDLPTLLAVYQDGVTIDPERLLVDHKLTPYLEYEWSIAYSSEVTICGRIDRAETGPKVFDIKTASEIGYHWKHDYKQSQLRELGVSMYDWYLCQVGLAPLMHSLEVIIKPYKAKPARLEIIPLPEIIAYRKRFEQQLKWLVREVADYHQQRGGEYPWPMAPGSTCVSKFGACDLLPVCNYGKVDLLIPRQEHLTIRGKNDRLIQRAVTND